MINGTTVIKAKDTASAMEKVVRELGEDCVILSTKKVNGQVSITASNSKKAKDAVKKRYDKKKFANIYKFNSGKLNINNNIINNPQKKIGEDKAIFSSFSGINYKDIIKEEMSILLEKIDKKLENIYITDNYKNYNFSNFLKLKQVGFSNKILEKFLDKNLENNYEESRINFFRKLSENLSSPFPERIFNSKLILVTGTSGTGKTTMAAKIASAIVDKLGRNNIVLAELCRNSKSASEDLKSFARLLNIPITNQLKNGDLSDTMILNDSAKIVVDLAGDIETGNKIIESLEARHGDNNICSILCLQSGSSIEMIGNTWKKIKAQRPIIALTKSDECNLSSMAMSKIAELKGKIGLVSGTRSIVDSLLFTNSDILAKYMKENF
jgi:flagellar biosynthesis protein FlhF